MANNRWVDLTPTERKFTFDRMAKGPGDWDWKYASQFPEMEQMWRLAQDVLSGKRLNEWQMSWRDNYRRKISNMLTLDGFVAAADFLK